MDVGDEGFMEGAIRVPKAYKVRILPRSKARSEFVRRQWEDARKTGYMLRGVHVSADGGVQRGEMGRV